ncbi:hypothetical protein F5146DRAFT_1042513 [Armillaria mellea]|nr:hypothetical protein F5146DRAFT_1042513 [Armillaria mellea]
MSTSDNSGREHRRRLRRPGYRFLLQCHHIGAAFCTGSSTWIVIGHRVCLHFSPAPSPYSEASLWSTFLFGFLGSATTALPFWVLFTSLDSDCEDYLPALLKLALITVKIALDCIIGVPVIADFGVVTLKPGYAVLAAYIGTATVILVMVCMTIMLILVAATLPGIEIRFVDSFFLLIILHYLMADTEHRETAIDFLIKPKRLPNGAPCSVHYSYASPHSRPGHSSVCS